MNQQIGNVGVLNLLNATDESIKGIDRIENVGAVLVRQNSVHLLTRLNIGNIGSTIEIPEGFNYYNGTLTINQAFLQSLTERLKLVVNGLIIFDTNIEPDPLKMELLELIVNGKAYTPPHFASFASRILSKGEIETYQGTPPRFENGKLNLTNAFLQSFDEPMNLVVNGLLNLAPDLNMELFLEKISSLEINGKAVLYKNQEPLLYKKTKSISGVVEAIPEGYEVLSKPLHINGRSIRRFQNKKFYTKKPFIIESDVTREQLTKAIASLHSQSIIVCPDVVEDLIYECLDLLETEVLPYEGQFIIIDGEEVWTNEQLLALEKPAHLVVTGQLILAEDVEGQVLREKLRTLDLVGEVLVKEKTLKGVLQGIIRHHSGSMEEEQNEVKGPLLRNVGELSL